MKKQLASYVISILLMGAVLVPSLPISGTISGVVHGHTVITPMNDWPEPMD
jgi:hypothetical protein